MKHRTFAFTDKIYHLLAPKPMGETDEISTLINTLESSQSCMISRLGSTELQTLCLIHFWPFSFMLKKRMYRLISDCSGFFPVNKSTLNQFYKLYKADVKDIDILITWRIEELLLKRWFKGKQIVRKDTLDTFYRQQTPWTKVLQGKRILVIHPFAESIKRQYEANRTKLFENEDVLPEFGSLTVIKAVQSLAGTKTDFDSWFDALEWMKSEIDKCDFDIALIGCGAYALPLAAHVKRMGKKSIHMGGILQFLFGIKGVRYEENELTAPFINEHFIYPDSTEKIPHSNIVEGGCYWGK
jgi:hypothetical protein